MDSKKVKETLYLGYMESSGTIVTIPKHRYMPPNHQFFLGFLEADMSKLDEIAESKDVEALAAAIAELHPYFSDFGAEKARVYAERSLTEPPVSMSLMTLKNYHERFNRFTAFLLRETDSEFSALPFNVKLGLFILSERESPTGGILSIPETANTFIPLPPEMKIVEACLDFDDGDLEEKFEAAAKDVVNDKLSLPAVYRQLAGRIDEASEISVIKEYNCGAFEDLLLTEAGAMLDEGCIVKKCAACGRYFATTDKKEKYCDIKSPDGKVACRDAVFIEDITPKLRKIYNTAYKTRYARVRAGKEDSKTLAVWREKARWLQPRVLSGEMTLKEYKDTITNKI